MSDNKNHVIKIILPKSLGRGGVFDLWQNGAPVRLLSQLANDHYFKQPTLKRDELAQLVELFKDEPLPDSLREALISDLKGKRLRRQGAPKKRASVREYMELIMLPRAYALALEDAEIERSRLRTLGRKQARYDDPERLPAASDLAYDLVRKRLPTLKKVKKRRLQNLVSEWRWVMEDQTDVDQLSRDSKS